MTNNALNVLIACSLDTYTTVMLRDLLGLTLSHTRSALVALQKRDFLVASKSDSGLVHYNSTPEGDEYLSQLHQRLNIWAEGRDE